MEGYFILFSLFFAIHYVVKRADKQLLLYMLLITVFSAIRYGIGYDYYVYLSCCIQGSFGGDMFEPIPRYFVILSQETFPFLFFILSSIFISFFYYLAIKNGGKEHYLEVLFYICFPFLFFNQLGIVRQAMASAVVFFAITIQNDSRLDILRKALLVYIAFLCHHSAIIAILLLFPWQRVSKNILWVMFIASFFGGLLVSAFAIQLVETNFLDEDTSERAIKYLNRSTQTEGNMIKLLIYIINVVSLLNYNKLVKVNKKYAYYIGLMVLGASLFALFDYNVSIAKRTCMLFFSVSIFIVPQIIRCMKIPEYIYVCACILLFIINIYVSSFNIRAEDHPGESASYPYRTYLF